MDISTIEGLITSVGFPIFCVLALGFFIYKSYEHIEKRNEGREEKLYSMLANSQSAIDNAIETNAKFVAQLESMQNNVNRITDDVDDIKEYLKLNKRVSDNKEE